MEEISIKQNKVNWWQISYILQNMCVVKKVLWRLTEFSGFKSGLYVITVCVSKSVSMSLFQIGVFFSVLTKDYSKSLHRHTQTHSELHITERTHLAFSIKKKNRKKCDSLQRFPIDYQVTLCCRTWPGSQGGGGEWAGLLAGVGVWRRDAWVLLGVGSA